MTPAQKLFRSPCVFVGSVAQWHQLPPCDKPEFAFVGRSNAGKSSLLNALVGQQVAKASSMPGRTQQLNFFCLNQQIYLVDLPGYGFAKAPKAQVKSWQSAMRTYLRGRPNLRRVFLLMDARQGVMKSDQEMMTMLDETAVVFQVVLTKADKLSAAQQAQAIRLAEQASAGHVARYPDVVLTSAQTGQGVDFVRQAVYTGIQHR